MPAWRSAKTLNTAFMYCLLHLFPLTPSPTRTLPPHTQADLQLMFPNAALYAAYGMTEACSSITFLTLHELVTSRGALASAARDIDLHHPHAAAVTAVTLPPATLAGGLMGLCVGGPPPGVEVKVLKGGPDTHRRGSSECSSTGRGTAEASGEVLTRGPHVMLRYWKEEEETNKVCMHARGPNGDDTWGPNWGTVAIRGQC